MTTIRQISDQQSAVNGSPAAGTISPAIKATAVLVAAWCLGFAAVNAWQLATGRLTDDQFAGAAMFAALTVSYHRRHRLHRTAVAAGITGPPVLLGGLLVVVPALLTTVGPP